MPPPRQPRAGRRKALDRRTLVTALSNEAMEDLENEVRALTRTTAQLEGQLETLHATLLRYPQRRSDNAARLCKEYCELFRHGYAMHDRTHAAKQTAMCHAVMCDDVGMWNNCIGPTGILTQWKRWSASFHNMHRDLHSIDVVHCEPSCVVRTHGTVFLRITRHTLEQLFPHVLADEALVQQVLGVELAAPVQTNYVMDSSCHRIQIVLGHVNFAHAFHAVVGNVVVTNAILADSLVQPSCELPASCFFEAVLNSAE